MKIICSLLILSAATLALPLAAEPNAATAQMAVDPLSVGVTGDAMNRVGHPVFVSFSIKNTANEDLLLKNVSIEVDPMVKDRFAANSAECVLQQRGEVLLKKGGVLEQGCRFEMKPAANGGLFGWTKELFATDVRYVVVASIDTKGDFRYYPSITVKADETSIFVGGFCGALLLAFFVWIQKLVADPQARKYWGRNFGYTALLGIRGGIMAMIALLIGKTTQGTGSPVALSVVDFTGGLMIGLFSYPLASWLANTLKIESISDAKADDRGAGGNDGTGKKNPPTKAAA